MTASTLTPGLVPSQAIGPFFHDCLLRADARRNVLVQPDTTGTGPTRIHIGGRVLDGDGMGVPDALVEIWQADSCGQYADPTASNLDFIGFGRSGTDEDGRFWFETIRPGAVPMGSGDTRMQAPHICVIVFARGLLNHLVTRLYFADEPATETDPILLLVPAERRETLFARRQTANDLARTAPAGDAIALYRWDIVLQGTGETVFFNL